MDHSLVNSSLWGAESKAFLMLKYCPQSAEDRRRGQQRRPLSWGPRGIRIVRALYLGFRGWRTGRQSLARAARSTRHLTAFRSPVDRPQGPRFQVRGLYHHLFPPAGLRPDQRSPGDLFSAPRVPGSLVRPPLELTPAQIRVIVPDQRQTESWVISSRPIRSILRS